MRWKADRCFAGPRMNTIIGEIHLCGDWRETRVRSFARSEGIRSLSRDDGSYRLRVNLATLTANFYESGARSVIVWGSCPQISAASGDDAILDVMHALGGDPKPALARLRGKWGLVFVDLERRRVLLAVDRAAQRPLCFHANAERAIFGLGARDVASSASVRPHLSTQAIFDYVRSHVIAAPDTIFDGVRRLQPGEYVDVTAAGTTNAFYWSPSYGAPAGGAISAKRARSRMAELLEDAVRKEIGTGATGAFLSGGTDSSSVAGMLGRITKAPARTYSIGFDAPGFDEMEYARIAAHHFGTAHHEYYLTPDDLVASIPEVARAYDQPFGNSSALPAYYCARLAASDGVTKMLGGDGGDEIFGGNTRYARQLVFDAYRRIPASLDRTIVEALFIRPGAARRLPLLRKARSYVVQARIAMPARMHTYNLVGRLGEREIFTPHFLQQIDSKRAGARETTWYARCADASVVNKMLQYDWKYTLADNDLPKVVTTCDLAGLDVGFPMLDESLVEFANSLPPDWKVTATVLRPFFKAALADFLPHEILRKKKHGFGLPFGWWLVEHRGLQRLASEKMASFRARGIVREDFLDHLFATHMDEHAGYYGELVWVMVMLEGWLQAYASDYHA